MKKALASFLVFICMNCVYSQFQIIYQPPTNRNIQTITAFRNNQNSNISFYLHLGGDIITAQPPYWIRYYRSTNQWNSNSASMLYGGTCFNGSGGFQFSQNSVIKRSAVDTNFILSRLDWISCNPQESGYRNRVSNNSGANWSEFTTSALYSFDIDKTNDSLIYGAGALYLQAAKFWRSTNRGASWVSFDIGGNFLDQTSLIINPLKPSEIYFSRAQNLYKSTNSGLNYIALGIFASAVKQIEVDRIDTSIFVLTGNGVYKSVNGGNNFTQVTTVNFNLIIFHPENHLILYGASQNGLYRTTNGGLNWNLYFDNFNGSSNVTGMVKYPNDLDTVYACINSGLYKIWGTLIGLQSIGESQPAEFSLFQNYPNPFNPVTKIKFDVPNGVPPLKGDRGMTVRLIIYDILGREVTTLINEQLKPGSYEADWDGSNFASDIYFYSLQTEEFTETKKMVLMK